MSKYITVFVMAFAVLATVHLADAQQAGKIYRIGWLSPGLSTHPIVEPFLEQLRTLGWREGRNFRMEQRYAAGKIEQLSTLATELVKLNVDIIVTVSTPGAVAAKQATATIPIVMAGSRKPGWARPR